MATDRSAPRLAFVNESDVPWQEVLAQRHGTCRVSVHEKFLEWTSDRMVVLGRYDPGVVVERHGHKSDHLVYVLEGDLLVGDRACAAGTLIVLEVGAAFGPLVAGAHGALLFEAWAGDPGPVPADKDGYLAVLRERGIERLPRPKIVRPVTAPGGRDDEPPEYG
jgi:hypothetical protein